MRMAKSKTSAGARENTGKQAAGANARGRAAQGGAAGGRGRSGSTGKGDGALTGTADEHYNLVSVLYHALKGAQTYAQYVRDAEEAGDSELAEFFEDMQEAERMRGERAKELLARRIKSGGQGAEGEEQDE
jgi:hypothetical protein